VESKKNQPNTGPWLVTPHCTYNALPQVRCALHHTKFIHSKYVFLPSTLMSFHTHDVAAIGKDGKKVLFRCTNLRISDFPDISNVRGGDSSHERMFERSNVRSSPAGSADPSWFYVKPSIRRPGKLASSLALANLVVWEVGLPSCPAELAPTHCPPPPARGRLQTISCFIPLNQRSKPRAILFQFYRVPAVFFSSPIFLLFSPFYLCFFSKHQPYPVSNLLISPLEWPYSVFLIFGGFASFEVAAERSPRPYCILASEPFGQGNPEWIQPDRPFG